MTLSSKMPASLRKSKRHLRLGHNQNANEAVELPFNMPKAQRLRRPLPDFATPKLASPLSTLEATIPDGGPAGRLGSKAHVIAEPCSPVALIARWPLTEFAAPFQIFRARLSIPPRLVRRQLGDPAADEPASRSNPCRR